MTLTPDPATNENQSGNEAPVVLVVDDEEGVREECADTLQSRGIPCITASGPEEALKALLSNRSVLVVLSDIRMPERSGFDLLEQVRLFCGGKYAVEVVLMSAYVGSLLGDHPARLQAAAFLPKPARADDICRVVMEVATKAADRRAAA